MTVLLNSKANTDIHNFFMFMLIFIILVWYCINFIKEGYPSFEKDTLLIFVDIAIVRDQSITGESE